MARQTTLTGSGATQTINLNSKTLTVTGNVDVAVRQGNNSSIKSSELKFTGGTLQLGTASVPVDVQLGSIDTAQGYVGKVSFVSNVTLNPYIDELKIGYDGGNQSGNGVFDLRNATIPGGVLAVNSLIVGKGARNVSVLQTDNSLNILNTLTVKNDMTFAGAWGKARLGYSTGGANNEHKLPAGFTINLGSASAPATSIKIGYDQYDGDGRILATSGGSFNVYAADMRLADVVANNQTRTTTGIVDVSTMDSCVIDVGTLIVAKDYGSPGTVNMKAIGQLKLPAGTLEADNVEVGAHKTGSEGLIELNGTSFKINSSLNMAATGTIHIKVKNNASNGNNVLDLGTITPVMEPTAKIKVTFLDGPPGTAAYFGFSWQGNHVAELTSMTQGENPQLVIDSTAIAPLTASIFMVGNTTVIGIPAQTTPAGIVWDGGGGANDNWSTAANWGTDTVPANPEGNILTFSAADTGKTGIVTSNWQIGGITSWQNTVTSATQTINLNSKTLTVTGDIYIADRRAGGNQPKSHELKFTGGTLQIGTPSVPASVYVGSININTTSVYLGKLSFVSNVTLLPNINELKIGYDTNVNQGDGGIVDLRNAVIPGGELAVNTLVIGSGANQVSALVTDNTLNILNTLTVKNDMIFGGNWGKARMGYPTGGANDEHKLPAGFTINIGSATTPASAVKIGHGQYNGNGRLYSTSGGSFNVYAADMRLADVELNSQTRTTYGIVDVSTMNSCTIDVGTLIVARDYGYPGTVNMTAIGSLKLPAGTLEADVVEVGAHKTGSSGLLELNSTNAKVNTSLLIEPTGIVRVNVKYGPDGKFAYLDLTDATLTINGTGKIELNFLQAPSTFVACNGLVMDGDHVSELQEKISSGNLVINDSSIAPAEAVVYKNGGKTYVGIQPVGHRWQQAQIAHYPSYDKVAITFRESLLTTPEGLNAGMRVTAYDSPDYTGTPTYVAVMPEPIRVNWWVRFGKWQGPDEMDAQQQLSAKWEGLLGPIPEGGMWNFHFATTAGTKVWLDDELIMDGGQVPQAFNALVERELEQGRTYRFVVESTATNPAIKNIDLIFNYWRRDGRTPTNADLVIYNAQDQVVLTENFTWTPPATLPVVVNLASSLPKNVVYDAQIVSDGCYNTVSQPIYNKSFAWEGTSYGVTQTIYPPFDAVTYNTSTNIVTAVMRKYVQNGIGLWNSVQATINDNMANGYQEILAAPMKLVANGNNVTGTGSFDTIASNASNGQSVFYNGNSTGGSPISITTHCQTEIDGVMKVTMTLGAGSINSLYLEIPLKEEMTPLYHVVRGPNPIRGNAAAATPATWDSKLKSNTDHWAGNFKAYLWFGAQERGLAWFADNEKGWELDWGSTSSLPTWIQNGFLLFDERDVLAFIDLGDNADPCQTLTTANGVRTLRIHFIQKPVTITTPRTITFGLMASPGKPMPTDWRTEGRSDSPRLGFAMGQMWGLDANNSAKYPRNYDWSIMNHFYNYRQNGGATPAVRAPLVAAWMAANTTPAMDQALQDSFENLVDQGIKKGNDLNPAGANTRFTCYYEEFHSTCPWHDDELKTYEGEWHLRFGVRDWSSLPDGPLTLDHKWWTNPTGNISPSYQDFATWYGKQWLDRSVGLYFDNAFLMACTNPVVSQAFIRPDGGIQPSSGIWARRDYLRRMWNMHQQYKNTSWPQAMMIHMTNTHILPMHVWNEYNLDLEWNLDVNLPFQRKFSPPLLCAESLGRQSGNYAHAMGRVGPQPNQELEPEAWATWNYNGLTHKLGLYVHEIRGPLIPTEPMPIEMENFGYGLPDCQVYNYWGPENVMTVTDTMVLPYGTAVGGEIEDGDEGDEEGEVVTSDIPFKSCKWLLLKRNGNLFLLLVSWDPDPQTVGLDLDYTALGVSAPGGARQWVDLDTSTTLTPDGNGDITVDMAGYGVGMYQLE